MTPTNATSALSNAGQKRGSINKSILNPLSYYHLLDYPSKIMFKREVLTQLEWCARTFHTRMITGEFRPGELLILSQIISKKTFSKATLILLQ